MPMSPDDMQRQRRRCEAENSGLPEECPCYVLGMQRGLAEGRERWQSAELRAERLAEEVAALRAENIELRKRLDATKQSEE